MELLFALFMTEKDNNLLNLTESLIERGYLPIKNLSQKYGYAKDYLGQLSRTGRIDAVRHGKYGQWYVLEKSLKEYQLSLVITSGSKPGVIPNGHEREIQV